MTAPSPEPAVFPRGVMDPLCTREHVIDTPTDHRILWYLERQLAASGAEDVRAEAANLRRYLAVACQHHWHNFVGGAVGAAYRQCIWCSSVEAITDAEAEAW